MADLTPMTLADLSGDITAAVSSSWDEPCPGCGVDVLAWETRDEGYGRGVWPGDDAVCLECGLVASWTTDGGGLPQVWLADGHGRITPESLAEARALRGEEPR